MASRWKSATGKVPLAGSCLTFMRLKQKIENNVQKSCDKIDSLFVVIKRANAYSEEAGNLKRYPAFLHPKLNMEC